MKRREGGQCSWFRCSEVFEPGTGNREQRTLNIKPKLGFTLLEMLVVLLIISVSMGLFFGMNFRQKESMIIRSFSSELSMFLSAARSSALLTGRENVCFYNPGSGLVFDELKGVSLAVPEKVDLVFSEFEPDKQMVLAIFYADGALVLEDFFIRSSEHEFFPEIDPFMGRVRFGPGV